MLAEYIWVDGITKLKATIPIASFGLFLFVMIHFDMTVCL
jgi:hypothetical protein